MKNLATQFQPVFSRRDADLARAAELDRKAVAMDELARAAAQWSIIESSRNWAGIYRREAMDLRSNWE